MRWPSAYCATSSGIAIDTRRVRAQPDWPVLVRIRLQSSVGTGLASGASGGPCSSSKSVFERSSQLGGGRGGAGIGGGGIFGSFAGFLGTDAAFFLGAGGRSGRRGT